jgi:hypothetical protein
MHLELIRAYYAALAPMAPPYFGVGNLATGRLTPVVLSSYVATAMTDDSPGVT